MLINRVGDVCLALGMFVCYYTFKSLDYTVMFALAPYMVHDTILILGMEMNSITVIGILFLLGAALVYYFIMPLAIKFFLSFESIGGHGTLPIQLEAKVNEYLSLIMRLIFAFGISFQLPVLLTLLARVGFVSSEGLRKNRKYVIVGVFAVAAILTPPDPISQIGLGIPILLLYEISIFAVKFIEGKKAKSD